jgi:two-component sensor histidine kinase
MLKDIINNQLTVIRTMNDLRASRPEETQRAVDYTSRSVAAIAEALQHLSDESLRSWKARHDHR